jgi:hypothetical protein
MGKILLGAITAVAASLLFVVPASGAGQGATVTNTCPLGPGNCDFFFFDGNGTPNQKFVAADYHDVLGPDGKETETFHGTIANGTGHAVLYSSDSGPPVTPGQTCLSFATGRTTPDWQMVISASGNYSLVCHF